MRLSLRPETEADGPFLLDLYASTRELERAALAAAPALWESLVRMQAEAQRRAYEARHPRAERSILTVDDEAVGRLVVDRGGGPIQLVDIAILPSQRGQGLGAEVLTALAREADEARRAVVLQVARSNPARRLYERFGFVRTGGDDVYDAMERPPQAAG